MLNGVEGPLTARSISDIDGLQLEYTMPVESLLYESRQVWANAWMISFGGAAEEGLVRGAQQDYFNL